MQFFVRPGTEMKWWNEWKNTRMAWHRALGFGDDDYRFNDHDKLAHYANAATDIEYNFPFGFTEVEGIHSRTDFDLGSHQKFSSKKLQYFDPETGESYVPLSLIHISADVAACRPAHVGRSGLDFAEDGRHKPLQIGRAHV